MVIEKYKSPVGDGKISPSSDTKELNIIEKYKSPVGDGKILSYSTINGFPELRNISPR